MRFFEDLEIDSIEELGTHVFTSEEIMTFAREFDPQPFHIDETQARESLFGGLCASGWHTVSIWMRKMVDFRKADVERRIQKGQDVARLGPSPGFENLKWMKPVFAGDKISFRTRITGKKATASRPEWGLIFMLNDGFNQNGETVFSFEGRVFVERDPDRRPSEQT